MLQKERTPSSELSSRHTYRVSINENSGTVVVSTFDGPYLSVEGSPFPSFEHLPERLQEKISALSLIPKGDVVLGLGRRVDDNIFWVYMDR